MGSRKKGRAEIPRVVNIRLGLIDLWKTLVMQDAQVQAMFEKAARQGNAPRNPELGKPMTSKDQRDSGLRNGQNAKLVPMERVEKNLKPIVFTEQLERRYVFECLALPLAGLLYARARRILGNATTAEDLVQETFLLGWIKFDQFQLGTDFKSWIVKILNNLCFNERRNRFSRNLSLDLMERPLASGCDNHHNPGLDWESGYSDLVDENLKKAINHLDKKQQKVFLLIALNDLTYIECADSLNIPVGTVMSRLSRARSHLKKLLGPRYKRNSNGKPDKDVVPG